MTRPPLFPLLGWLPLHAGMEGGGADIGHVAIALHTCPCLQSSGSENQVSSTTTSGVLGLPLYATATIEDVKTTRLTDGAFAHELRTLSDPFTAGSSSSA